MTSYALAVALGEVDELVGRQHGDEAKPRWMLSTDRRETIVDDTRRRDLPSASPADVKSAGYPGETAMAATKLALAGVLADYPDVKIICSHLARRWFAVVAVSVTLAAPIRPVTTCIVATLIPRVLMVLR